MAKIAMTMALAASFAIPADGQEAGGAAVASGLQRGDTIVVMRTSAPTLKGILIAADDDGLTIQDGGGPARIPLAAVARIWKDDPLWNGALIGAGVGAAAMGVMVGGCKRHDAECRNIATDIGLVVTGGMAAVATLVDHFRRKLMYERPGFHASLTPVAPPRGGGVAVRVRF